MEWTARSEVLFGLCLMGKIDPHTIDPDILQYPYDEGVIMLKDGKERLELQDSLSFLIVDAAEMAASQVKPRDVKDFVELCKQSAVRFQVSTLLEPLIKRWKRGEKADVGVAIDALRRLEYNTKILTPLGDVTPLDVVWRPTYYAPHDEYFSGVPESSLVVIGGAPKCLTGDVLVGLNRGGKSFQSTIKDLVYMQNGGVAGGKTWDPNIPTMIRSRSDDGAIRLESLARAVPNGIRNVIQLTTKSGKRLKGTWDHPILTEHGWEYLCDLNLGSMVFVEGSPKLKEVQPHITRPAMEGFRFHPYASRKKSGRCTVMTHRLVMEAYMSGVPFDEFVSRCRTGPVDRFVFLDPKEYSVHHKDKDPMNFNFTNLEVMERIVHHRRHGKEYRGWGVLAKTIAEPVIGLKQLGEEDVFDVALDAHPHNFLANNIVVHNTGKTTYVTRIAMECARNKKKVAFFSLEMTLPQLKHRILQMDKKIGKTALNYIYGDDGIWKVTQLYAHICNFVAKNPDLHMIIVDFADMIMPDDNIGANRVAFVDHVYYTMAAAAKVTNVPIIMLSQLNANYIGGRPRVNHLRGSRLIEGLGAMVLLLYNPNLLDVEQNSGALRADPGTAWIILGASRYGMSKGTLGAVQVDWNAEKGWGNKVLNWVALAGG